MTNSPKLRLAFLALLFIGSFAQAETYTDDTIPTVDITTDAIFDITNSAVYSGVISGSGTVSKIGAGALTLSGANTYTGATTVSAGTLTFSSSTLPVSAMTATGGTLVLGTAGNAITAPGGSSIKTNSGAVRLDGNLTISSGTVTVQGAWTGNGAINLKGGELRVTTNFSYDKGITLSGGTLRNATDGRTVTVSAPLNLVSESYFKSGWEKNMTLTGSITGAGKFHVKTDSGYVIAATTCTDNSFTGSIHTDNESGSYGLLRLGANNPFGTNAGEARIWGTLDMNGYSQTFAGVANSDSTTAGKVKGTSSSVLTLKLNSNASKVYGGSFEGALSLVLTGDGSGTQIFKKAPAYTGSTTVQAGTLQLDAGGTLYNLSGAGTVKFGSKTLTLSNSADTTFSGSLSGSGQISIANNNKSKWIVMATTCENNSFTGNVVINYSDSDSTSQGRVRLGKDNAFGTSAGQASIYGTLDMNGYSQRFKGLYNNGDKGSIYNNAESLSTLTIDTTGKDLNFQSSITGNIALVITGNGTQTLNKAPEYTGSTTVESGTLKLNAASKLNNLSGAGTVNYGSTSRLTLYNSAATEFSGHISGSGELVFDNNTYEDGWIVMNTTCDVTGKIRIFYGNASNQGKVRLGRDNAFGLSAGEAQIYGTLDMNGHSQTLNGLSNNGNKGKIYNEKDTLSTLTINTTGKDLNFQSSITGNIALVITGTGTQTLNKAPEYTGSTTVESGTLILNAGGTLYNLSGTNAGVLNNNGNAITIESSSDTEFAGVIAGSGGLTKSGTKTLTLSGANTYTGATTVSGGVLELIDDAVVANGPITVGANGTLEYNLSSGKTQLLTIFETSDSNNKIKSTGKVVKTGDGTLQICTAAAGQVDATSFVISSGRLDMKEYFKGSLAVEAGATLSPGNSVGTLTVDGEFSLDSGATLLMEVGKNDQGEIVVDQLILSGDIGESPFAQGSIINIVMDPASGLQGGDSFTDLVFITTSSDADAASIYDAVKNATFSYYFPGFEVKLDGNNILLSGTLDSNAVPEPSTWALMILGAAGLLYWRKRKN